MKESIPPCQRVEVGLGNPLKEYTNDDSELSNCCKVLTSFWQKKPHELIDEIKKLIHSTTMQIVPCLGRVCMTLQIDLNILLYLIIKRNID